MRSFIQRLFDTKRGAVKRSNQRPRLQVETLENRLTPSTVALTTSTLLDVTSAPIALTAFPPGPSTVMLEIDGTLHLASGSAEQAVSFTIKKDVAGVVLGPRDRQTSFKVDFDESTDLTLAGSKESIILQGSFKGDAAVSLKIDGTAEVASIRFEDVASLKLEGTTAEGDLTLHGAVSWSGPGDSTGATVAFIWFDKEAASPTTSQNDVASSSGGGGVGKITLADSWNTVLTGPVASVQTQDTTDLTHDNTPLMRKAGDGRFTLANTTAAPSAAAPSLMLDETDSFSLDFATASIERNEKWDLAGDVISLKFDDLLMLNDGPSTTATQETHVQATGGVTSFVYGELITLTPNDPANLASDTQHIECANGNHITLTVDDTVHLNVDGMELTSHTRQTKTGDVVSIDILSLLSKPGPGG
jgi:hypothetical protein